MARWEHRLVKREPLDKIFRKFFFAGIICNFIGIFAAMSIKYYEDEITVAKWKGVLAGFAFNMLGFVWAIIATSVIKNPALVLITLLILVSGWIFGFSYNYKK